MADAASCMCDQETDRLADRLLAPLVESFEVRILAQQTFDLQATDRWLLGRQPS